MNEFEFDRLLDLYEKGRLTKDERKIVDDWFDQLNASPGAPLTQSDKYRLKEEIFNRIKTSAPAAPAIGQRNLAPQHTRRTLLKIAASILILFLIGFGALQFYEAKKDHITTSSRIGSITKVSLPDGSLVWLKGESSLESPTVFKDNDRRVILNGEALFEVAKDPNRPFSIQCGEVTTTVLGTSFNIKSLEGGVEVAVLTGKVALTSLNDLKGVVVLPNEKVIYDPEKLLISKETIKSNYKTATLDGTDYNMVFHDVAMDEVLRRMEKKFDVKIALSNERLRNCKIRADFSDQSLENTLRMISQALGLSYSIKNGTVHLTGEGCQ